MVKGTALPSGMRDAQFIVESGCVFTLDELDVMPVELLERIIMYRGIRAVKLSGD